MADAPWTPKFTLGLFPTIQRHIREGGTYAGLWDAVHAADLAPDAATVARLFRRAAGGVAAEVREARYRGSVDRDLYLARRPGGDHIAPLDRTYLKTPWRQVVRVIGTNPLTGAPASQRISVQFSRLLTRGEAIQVAMDAVIAGKARYDLTAEDAEYEVTWRRE